MHLRALRAIALAHRAEGRWQEVVTVARTAVRQDALQEPMYRALMEAHAQMGDRAMAIRQYDSLRATLDRELGVTPLPETDQLRAEILQGKLTEAPDAHVTVAETPVTPGAAEAQPTRSQQPFIGREQEIATLDGVWAMARATPARVALISGEAGVGKSRLWQMWSSRLEPDVTLLTARCLPTTQSLPFAPLVDLLRGPNVRRRLAKLAHPSPPVWLDDILQLVPELRETLPAHTQAPALPAIEEQRRMFEAVEHDWPHPLALVEHSHAGLASAYVAGASNLPFGVLRGYTGSDLPKYNEHIRFIPCPFTGEEVAAVQSVRPDVTVIHAQKADRKGNVLLWGILGVQKEAALAAKHAIVTVEEVVDDLDAWPNAAILPSWAISAVCEVPGGSHPSYAQGYYERDNHFYQAWDKISRSRDSFQAWMQRHVLDTADFSEFTQTLRETEEMEAR